jgi:hypothetical protein
VSRLSQLFPKQVRFSYGCPDRIVIRGYYPALQRPDSIVHFFHDVAGLPVVDSAALASRTTAYRQWVAAFAKKHRIEQLAAPKRARKEDLVQPYYRRLGEHEGVACILTSMEQGSSPMFLASRPPTRTIGSSGAAGNYSSISTSTCSTASWDRCASASVRTCRLGSSSI